MKRNTSETSTASSSSLEPHSRIQLAIQYVVAYTLLTMVQKKKKKKKYNIADTAVKFLDTARLVACPGLATQMQTIKSETRGHTAEIFDLAQVGLSAVQSLMCWPVSLVDGPRPHNTPYQVPFFFPQHSHAPFKLRLELCSLSFLFCTNKLFSLCFKWRPLCFTDIFATPLCNTPQGTF